MKPLLYFTVFTAVTIGVFCYPSSSRSPIMNDESSQGKQARQFLPFFPLFGFRHPLLNYSFNHNLDTNGPLVPMPSYIDFNTSYDGAYIGSSDLVYPTNFPFGLLAPFMPPVTLNMDVNATNKLNLTLQAAAGNNATNPTTGSLSSAMNGGISTGTREGAGSTELGNRPIETDDKPRARPVNDDGRRPNQSHSNSRPQSSFSVSSNQPSSSSVNDNQLLPAEIQVEVPQVSSALEAGEVTLDQSQGMTDDVGTGTGSNSLHEAFQIAPHAASST